MANNIMEETGEGNEEANLAVANRKRAIFLTEIGPEAYSTLSNLLALVKPKDTPFCRHCQSIRETLQSSGIGDSREFSFWNLLSKTRRIHQ